MKTFTKKLSQAILITALFSMTACGGGGGSSNTGGTTSQAGKTAAEVSTDLATTNLINTSPNYANAAFGVIKRWPVESELIPVKLNGSANATHALDAIEATLGKTLFDRTSIANIADASITKGLIISIGTASPPPGTTVTPGQACGNVSSTPGSLTITGMITDTTGAMNSRLYVNLGGNGSDGCAPINDELAIHEIGHSLGLASHFSGFGTDMELGSNYWNVLKSLYANPVGAVPSTVYTGVVQGQASSGTAHAFISSGSTTPSFNGIGLAGKTAKLLPPVASGQLNIRYEFTFAASGNGVTSGLNSGTYSSNPDGTITMNFPGESVTMTLTSNNALGIKVSLVDSLAPSATISNVTMTFVAPTVIPAVVASKTFDVYASSITAAGASGFRYIFDASGTGVSVADLAVNYTTSVTTLGTPVAGTYTTNSDGSITVSAAIGSATIAARNVLGGGYGTMADYMKTTAPLQRLGFVIP